MASCSSRIYASPHGVVCGLASMKRGCAGALSKRHLSAYGGLIEVRIGSTGSLQKPQLREKKENTGLSCRNVQTNGQELQTDDIGKPKIAILLEVEGKAGGDDERMLYLFFERIGWPTSLPTDEQESFLKNVLREKGHALEDYVKSRGLSLRPGIDKFVDDAFEEQIPVIILSAYSRNGEETARYIVEKLGSDRAYKFKVVGQEEVEKSFYAQLVLGKGISTGTDEVLENEVSKADAAERQRVAEEVVSMLTLNAEIDTAPNEMSKKIIASLCAGAEYADTPFQNCILLSGSQAGVCAAQCIGMPCIVIRSSSISRTEFPSARAVVEGFGFGELTVSKIFRMRE